MNTSSELNLVVRFFEKYDVLANGLNKSHRKMINRLLDKILSNSPGSNFSI